jgi:GNAT superfamily N-acetyltransferase
MTVRIEPLTGSRLTTHLPDLARLRIEVFRAYPYLYDGDLDYEERYLSSLAASPNGAIIAAFDGDAIVGASTAAPLSGMMDEITAPFRAREDDLSRYFYFGESVLKPSHRGLGVGVRFFELREAHARVHYARTATFCSVIRPADHPARPEQYVPLDQFWRNRGYAPEPGLICHLSWKEVGEPNQTPKPMQFWTKRLAS